jgi:hypothetical protein
MPLSRSSDYVVEERTSPDLKVDAVLGRDAQATAPLPSARAIPYN